MRRAFFKLALIVILPVAVLISCVEETPAYRCLDAGGIVTKYETCLCHAYSAIGQCISFVQHTNLVADDGSTFYFQSAGTKRGIHINGEPLNVEIIENAQGLTFYSADAKVAIFLPRTVSVNSAQFFERNCSFAFRRNVIVENRKHFKAMTSDQINDPIEFIVNSHCDSEPMTSYRLNDGLKLIEIELSDGRHFRTKDDD